MAIRDTSGQDQMLARSGRQLRRRWLLVGALALVLVLLAGWLVSSWSAGSHSLDGAGVRIAVVKRGDLVRDISAEGRVIAANSPILYAIAGGTVTLEVVAGDVVKKGQLLAVVDSPELRSRLAQEEASLASLEAEAGRAGLDAQITLSMAQRALDQAEVDRQAAARDLERFRVAHAGGAIAELDVARAGDALRKAELGLEHARREFALQEKGSGLDGRNKQLQADRQRAVVDELQRQVDLLTLRAPFDGQVGQVLVDQFTNVAANTGVLGVVDLSLFEVEIKVPESFARDLAIGMNAQLNSGGNTSFAATVSAVSPEVVNGEVTARLRFVDGQPAGLRQNQRMRARVVLDTRQDVLMVERGPFLDQGGGNFAYVMEGSVAVRRPVRMGVSSLSAVEVIDGIAEGERVVVSGADRFDAAARVRISGR